MVGWQRPKIHGWRRMRSFFQQALASSCNSHIQQHFVASFFLVCLLFVFSGIGADSGSLILLVLLFWELRMGIWHGLVFNTGWFQRLVHFACVCLSRRWYLFSRKVDCYDGFRVEVIPIM
jgi:hypothetical protein